MAAPESDLRPRGEVEEFYAVNTRGHSTLAAAPLPAAVDRQSEPAVKVVGDAGAGAARIPPQAAAHRGVAPGSKPWMSQPG